MTHPYVESAIFSTIQNGNWFMLTIFEITFPSKPCNKVVKLNVNTINFQSGSGSTVRYCIFQLFTD